MDSREPTKRERRQQKREVKRAGNQRLRRQLKRALADDPEQVPDAEFDRGRYRSEPLNGMDRDPTRRRPEARGGPGKADESPS
jgi:hypothetical protein